LLAKSRHVPTSYGIQSRLAERAGNNNTKGALDLLLQLGAALLVLIGFFYIQRHPGDCSGHRLRDSTPRRADFFPHLIEVLGPEDGTFQIGAQPLGRHAGFACMPVVPHPTGRAVLELPRFQIFDFHGTHLPISSWRVSATAPSPASAAPAG